MAEYIDVPNLILFLKCGEYESSEDIIKFIENNVTTDVIERTEYNKLHEEHLKAIHRHTQCLKELHDYRSKINKAIEEMERIIKDTSYFYTSEGVKLALEILKRIIGV